jgi:hypothetical protein
MRTVEPEPGVVTALSPVQNFLFGHSRGQVVYDCR